MTSAIPRLRIVSFNDVYELTNLPRLQTFLSKLSPLPDAIVLAGDFLSPSTLSALDGGKGMVQTLSAIGLTHVSLGNHEADLRLNKLKRRLDQLQKRVHILNSNIKSFPKAPWLEELESYSVVRTECGRVRVGLCGLMSDEAGMFRDNTFRGAPIASVMDTVDALCQHVPTNFDCLLPLTHQSIKRDKQLAEHMLHQNMGSGIILGGHEHEPIDATVTHGDHFIRILKSGMDCQAVQLVDILFDVDKQVRVAEVNANLIPLVEFEPSHVIQRIVDSHMALLTSMEHEEIIHADAFLPPGVTLSSVGSRFRQTTVGGVLCMAIKEELEVDVAMINGATIKGDTEYSNASISYAQLKKELPFPTKMVVVPMKRWHLQEAIHYSRTQPPSEDPMTPRRGFLQVDMEFDRLGFHTGSQEDDLMVALPRNLMKGFCEIQPLMDLGAQLKARGEFPGPDDFIPALDLVIRHFSKEKWYEIVHENMTFDDLDHDKKGFLSRQDVQRMLTKAIGHEPAGFVIDDMIAAVDADENGVIDPGEFSHLLAEMEREHGQLIQFD